MDYNEVTIAMYMQLLCILIIAIGVCAVVYMYLHVWYIGSHSYVYYHPLNPLGSCTVNINSTKVQCGYQELLCVKVAGTTMISNDGQFLVKYTVVCVPRRTLECVVNTDYTSDSCNRG